VDSMKVISTSHQPTGTLPFQTLWQQIAEALLFLPLGTSVEIECTVRTRRALLRGRTGISTFCSIAHDIILLSCINRVLWKTLPGFKATLLSYGCCDRITTRSPQRELTLRWLLTMCDCSDHSPVFATFEVGTLRLIPTQPVPNEVPVKYTIIITDLWAKVRFSSLCSQLLTFSKLDHRA